MTEVARPDLTYQWSSGGSIIAPSNIKIQTGWTAEVPPFQWENWAQNRQDNALVHLFQKGISTWSATQDYYFTVGGTRSFVQGSDGFIYEAVQSSTNQNPTTDATNTYWKQAFRSQSGAQIYALDTGTANAYKADYTPVVKTLVDGMVLKFKVANANTAASTFTPANGVITAAPLVGLNHTALQGGEFIAGGEVWVQWNSSVGGGSWVVITNSGGGLQIAPPTKANHAVNLAEFAGLFSTSGYMKFPAIVAGVKRTLIFQWITVPNVGTGGVVANWPIAFPSSLMIAWSTVSITTGPITQYVGVLAGGISSIQVVINTGTAACAVFGIGY